MAYARTYSEADVSRILRNSEGQRTALDPAGVAGHAEGLHTLVAEGRGRSNTTLSGLHDRMSPEILRAGAFAGKGTQVRLVTTALNCNAGQTALTLLSDAKARNVFARIRTADLYGGQGEMISARGQVLPNGNQTVSIIVSDEEQATIEGVALNLKRGVSGLLHINTAFPLAQCPASTCTVNYEGVGRQTFPLS